MGERHVRFDHVNQRPPSRPPQAGNLGPFRRLGHKFSAAEREPGPTKRDRPGQPDAGGPEHGDSF